jgi:hypothetical protein
MALFHSINAIAQRNAQDRLNLVKIQELNAVINQIINPL